MLPRVYIIGIGQHVPHRNCGFRPNFSLSEIRLRTFVADLVMSLFIMKYTILFMYRGVVK